MEKPIIYYKFINMYKMSALITFMLYFCKALESPLCEAFPKNKYGRISTGASRNRLCVVLSQSDDSVELLQAESEYGGEIRRDLKHKANTYELAFY